MRSSSSLALAAWLLASCTAFSEADIDPPSGEAGAAGTLSGSSGQAGGSSGSSGSAGQGGVSGAAGLAGSGGQAGLAGGPAGGVSGDGGTAGDGASGGAGDSGAAGAGEGPGGAGQTAGGSSGSSGQNGGSAGSTSGAGAGGSSSSGASGTAGSAGGAGKGGSAGSSGSAGGGASGSGGSGGAVCGDGVVQPGEECDDGASNASGPGNCSTACQKSCAAGSLGSAFKVGATCYVLLAGQTKWDDARTKCEAYGNQGHFALSSIETQDEFTAMATKLKNVALSQQLWLGGHRVGNKLTWLSGSPVSFPGGQPPWASNQPVGTLDCMYLQAQLLMEPALYTDSCNAQHTTLCEW